MKSEITPTPGVIDSLTAGFRILARAPWLILIPVLLDVALWLGPQLSVRSLMTPLAAAVQAPPGAPLTGEYQEALEASRQLLTDFGDHFNLLSVLANGLLGMPSLAGDIGSSNPSPVSQTDRFDLPTFGSLVIWFMALVILSVIIAAFYLALIAQVMRPTPWRFSAVARSSVVAAGRLLAFTLLLGLLLTLASIPLALFAGALTLAGGAAGALLAVSAVVFFGWWIRLGLTFIAPALVLDEVNLRQGVWRSVSLAARNLLSTMGLVIVVNLVGAGFGLVWQRLASGSLGMVFSILGNAVLGTGLLIGVFVFYRDHTNVEFAGH